MFGAKVTDEFNEVNKIDLIARAHQLVMEGKKYHFPNRNLVTVWSAPNYCYRCGNVAAILRIGDNEVGENSDDSETQENESVDLNGIKQSFKYFNETSESQYGPSGESRAQLVPYFL